MNFLSLEYDTFSLEVSDSSVKIIKLVKSGKNFSVNSFNEIAVKPGIVESGIIKNEEDLVEIIKAACKKVRGKKLRTKYVIASLPEEEAFLQVIQMPKMTEDELKSAIVFEAENYIPMPMDKVYFDFQIVEPIIDGLDHLDVLIVAIPKKVADSYVSCIKKAGLIPAVLEIESQATSRSLIKNEMSDCPVILVDLNDSCPNFVIFSGNSVRFTSSTSVLRDGQKFAKCKTKSVKTLLWENLSAQIEKYADFYKEHASHEHILNGESIKKVILSGREMDLRGLAGFISEKTGIEAEIGDPFINFKKQEDSNSRMKDPLCFTTAIGLSLRNFNISNFTR